MRAEEKTFECCELFTRQQIQYGVSFWLLQERACLSYSEARIYLAIYRNENPKVLAKQFRISKKKLKKKYKSACKKIERFGGKNEVMMGYCPRVMELSPPCLDTCSEMRKKAMLIHGLDDIPLF